jgi:hypothetical protein
VFSRVKDDIKDKDRWIRGVPLLLLIFEGTVKKGGFSRRFFKLFFVFVFEMFEKTKCVCV